MRRWVLLVVPVVVLVVSCGGGDSTPATVATATTTPEPAAPDTTGPELSRDALVAVQRCLDATPPVKLPVDAQYEGASALETPAALCDEAYAQVVVDVGADNALSKAVASVASAIARANLAITVDGSLDTTERADFLAALNAARQAVDDALPEP